MSTPDDPQFQPSEAGQPAWRPQPGWQPQPSWEPQHGWDQPPITEVTPVAGDEEPFGAAPAYYPPPAAGHLPAGYLMAGQPLSEQAGRRPRSKRGWIFGAAAAALLLVLGGGGVAAFQVLNGGGTQPDQVVPADTVAFAKLDLNPSASQKIAAARLLHRIPKLGSGFSGGSSDWRKAIFDALSANDSLPAGVDFDHDVKPWLGKRAAVAVLPTMHGGHPEVLLVLQSTNDAKARVGISNFGTDNGVSFYHGYAVVAETQQLADQAVADAKRANLSGSSRYAADMKQLGSLGVSAGWADFGAVAKLAGSASPMSAAVPSGRLAYTVRLTANSADLIGRVYGLSGSQLPATQPDLGRLPASTAIAVGVATSPAAIDSTWQHYQDLLTKLATPAAGFSDPADPSFTAPSPSDLINQFQQQFGIQLPGDLKTLLGTGVTVSVAADGLTTGSPKFTVQSRTNGAAAARVLDHIRQAMDVPGGPGFPLQYQSSSDGVIVGNDHGYLAAVGAGSGPKLSSLAAFRQSLPDRAGAQYTAFVNLDAVAAGLRASGASQDDLQTISSFSAAGLTVRMDGSTADLHLRLVAH